MKHRLLISALLAAVALVGTAVVASAHGENAQLWLASSSTSVAH